MRFLWDGCVLNSLMVTGGGAFTVGADATSVHAATMTMANGGVLTVNAFHAGFYIVANLVVTNGGVVYANNYPFVGAGSTPSATFSGPVRVENGGLLVANNVNVGGFGGSWFSIGPGGVLTGSGGFAALTNAGMINLTNTSIHGDLLNQPGGVVNLAGGATLSGNSFGGNYFTNLGTVLASGASPNTISSAHFETRQGTVTNLSGVLSMGTLMNLTGTYFAAAGATNQFAAINDGVNYATPGTPLVLAGPGQFQFSSGDLYLPANVIPNLALRGGQLQLGAGFQGGAITNLTLEGITLLGNSLPITGNLSATKNSAIEGDSVVASGGRFAAANFYSLGSIRVNNGGSFTASAFTNAAPLLVAAGGVANLADAISVYAPCTNSGSINLSNATVSVFNDVFWGRFGSIFNVAGGAMNFLGDGSSIFYNYGAEPFINQGSLVFNSPLGTNSINFLNLDLSQGTVTNLAGTAILRVFQTNLVGTYYAAAGAIIQFKNSNVDFVKGYDFNIVTNFATPGTPFVLNGGGDFQFAGGNLYLPTNVPPHLSLVGGILKLGPNFQGGAITNLTFAGFLLTNPLAAAFPITGTLTVSNCGGGRYISYNQTLPTGVWGNFTVASGEVLHSYSSSFNNNLTVAAGGLVSLVRGSLSVSSSGTLSVANGGTINIAPGGVTLFGPLNNAGIINISNPPPAFISYIMSANDGSALYRGGILNQASGIINLADDNAYLTTYNYGKEYLVNQGQIVKTGGTNYSVVAVPFITNSGAITVQSGKMGMRPFVTQPGGSLNVVLNNATNYGSFDISSNLVLAGTFNASLATGYVPANGTTFNVLSYQCHPIGNMHKPIDFISVLKTGRRLKRHTPSHSVWDCQKALIFDGFHAFPVGWLCYPTLRILETSPASDFRRACPGSPITAAPISPSLPAARNRSLQPLTYLGLI